jgi:NADP-dependent 3-hydroxy acid dehydrogenase YdfG
MNDSMDNKAVVITGASSGIGRVLSVTLGRLGADLWLTGRDEAALAETADLVREGGGAGAVRCEALDLAEPGALAGFVARAAADHPHLFALVNNAGIMHPEAVLDGTRERWRAMLDVNVLATLEGCQAAVAAMRQHRRGGHIVNVGSLQGRFEVPGVYGVTKKAIEMIGASLRAELEEDDIRVCTVIPGGFATQLARGFRSEELAQIAASMDIGADGIPLADPRRLGDPQHVADAIVYVLGQPIDINLQEIVIRPPVDTKV